MRTVCVSCGIKFNVSKGNCKYCVTCRDEIYRSRKKYGGYSKAAKVIIEMHKPDRIANGFAVMTRKRKPTIAEVVRQATANGRSYGHEVAIMEGRMH